MRVILPSHTALYGMNWNCHTIEDGPEPLRHVDVLLPVQGEQGEPARSQAEPLHVNQP